MKNSRLPGRYYIIPVIYVGVIILLFYLHFFSFDTVTERIGSITLQARIKSGQSGSENESSDIKIVIEPVEFTFNSRNSIAIKTGSGEWRDLSVQSYSVVPKGVEIRFSEQTFLTFFRQGNTSTGVTIQPLLGGDMDISALSIPFSLDPAAEFQTAGHIPIISVQKGRSRFFITSRQNVRIDPSAGSITIPVDNRDLPEISLSPVNDGAADPLTYWFSHEALQLSEGDFLKRVEGYIDKAFRGWTDTRLDSSRSGLMSGSGEYSFSEKLVSVLLAESIVRDVYPEVFNSVQPVIASRQERLTFTSNTYFGGLQPTFNTWQQQTGEKIQDLREKLARDDFSVFYDTNLVQSIVNHAPLSLLEEVFRLTGLADTDTLDTSIHIGMLNALVQAYDLNVDYDGIINDMEKFIEELILPWIIKTDDGLFFQYKNGASNVFESLSAGYLLSRCGTIMDTPSYTSIGRSLILACLGLSDEYGFIPGLLTFDADSMQKMEGKISPELIYSQLTDNPYVPHEISLHREAGPGSWIWTSADIEDITVTDTRWDITMTFPEGFSHYFILQGIPQFKRIEFYGITWASDPSFEFYTSGWLYDEEGETLFAKLLQRSGTETISLFF